MQDLEQLTNNYYSRQKEMKENFQAKVKKLLKSRIEYFNSTSLEIKIKDIETKFESEYNDEGGSDDLEYNYVSFEIKGQDQKRIDTIIETLETLNEDFCQGICDNVIELGTMEGVEVNSDILSKDLENTLNSILNYVDNNMDLIHGIHSYGDYSLMKYLGE